MQNLDFSKLTDQQLSQLRSALGTLIVDKRQELIENILEHSTTHMTLVLENLYQEHNASAIMRNADAFGVRQINVIESSNMFRSNAGIAVSADKWIDLQNWQGADATRDCISGLKKRGYRIVATTLKPGAVPLEDLSVKEPFALMFGTEQTGLSQIAHEMADEMVYVPMQGFVQSLNVSCTSAIAMHDLGRRIRSQVPDWQLNERYRDEMRLQWLLRGLRGRDDILRRKLEELGLEL